MGLPSESVSNGREVSISPMSSTRNSTMLGLSCEKAACAADNKEIEVSSNLFIIEYLLVHVIHNRGCYLCRSQIDCHANIHLFIYIANRGKYMIIYSGGNYGE